MAKKTLRLTRGDHRPIIRGSLQNDDGTPYVIGGTDVVRFRLAPRGGGGPVLVKAATVTDAANGKVEATLTGEDLDLPAGIYLPGFEVDVGGAGVIHSSASTDPELIEVVEALAANMLTNSSFESDLTGWTTENLGGGTIAASTERAFAGSKSCKFAIPTQSSDLNAQVYQTVAVPTAMRGDAAMLQARVCAIALPDSGVGAGYRVRIDESKDGGATFTMVATGTETLTLNEWVRLTVTGTLGANATHVRAIVLSRRGATMYVDAVQIEAGPRATPYRET